MAYSAQQAFDGHLYYNGSPDPELYPSCGGFTSDGQYSSLEYRTAQDGLPSHGWAHAYTTPETTQGFYTNSSEVHHLQLTNEQIDVPPILEVAMPSFYVLRQLSSCACSLNHRLNQKSVLHNLPSSILTILCLMCNHSVLSLTNGSPSNPS